MKVDVLAPGASTTLQDQGRDGHRHLGVPHAGALDPDAAWLANRLVGNDGGEAVLEIALRGPTLRFARAVRVALLGAEADMRFDDVALPRGRPLSLPAGTLRIGALRGGARAWLAVDGGFDATPALGSRSTDLRGGFGGFEGRALRSGDVLALASCNAPVIVAPAIPAWWIDPAADVPASAPIRFVPATHPAAARLASHLASGDWRVDPRSDRQGLRLGGAKLDHDARDGVSEPVAPGTIQLPPDGQPIVLLADAQTIGGYPRLGHVVACDLPRLAQLLPHAPLRLAACTQAMALQALRAAHHARMRLSLAIDAKRQ